MKNLLFVILSLFIPIVALADFSDFDVTQCVHKDLKGDPDLKVQFTQSSQKDLFSINIYEKFTSKFNNDVLWPEILWKTFSVSQDEKYYKFSESHGYASIVVESPVPTSSPKNENATLDFGKGNTPVKLFCNTAY